jgi:predicted DNA-binding protein YlxM (UPF0122 family)
MKSKNDIILYIWNNGEIISYCKAVGKNNWEELRSDLITQLYKMDFNKLLQAYYNNFLEYTCFTICSRIKKGKIPDTGLFYQHGSVNLQLDVEDIFDIEDKSEKVLDLYEKVLSLVDEQHWYNETLFKHYYIDGLKLREISDMYKINIKSIHYAIGKVKSEIKKQLENDNNTFFWN